MAAILNQCFFWPALSSGFKNRHAVASTPGNSLYFLFFQLMQQIYVKALALFQLICCGTLYTDHKQYPQRKNYSGSGAVWSSELTAVMYSLFETLKIWKLNEHAWLLNYFYECALIGGKPPDNIEKYLPWNMTEDQRVLLSEPPHQNLE